MISDSDPQLWKIYTCTGAGFDNNGCQKPVRLHKWYEVSDEWDDKGRRYQIIKCPKCGVLTDLLGSNRLSIQYNTHKKEGQ